MSDLSAFYGTYVVDSTVDTPFGVITDVIVSSPSSSTFEVQFVGPSLDVLFSSQSGTASFDSTAGAIILSGTDKLTFAIALFQDDQDPDYRLLCGYNVTDGTLFIARYYEAAANGGYELSTTPPPASDFAGTYAAAVTGGAQFGKASQMQLTDPGDGSILVQIQGLPDISCSLVDTVLRGSTTLRYGDDSTAPLTLQISRVSIPGTKPASQYIFGLTVAGDPQQAGTFGSDTDP